MGALEGSVSEKEEVRRQGPMCEDVPGLDGGTLVACWGNGWVRYNLQNHLVYLSCFLLLLLLRWTYVLAHVVSSQIFCFSIIQLEICMLREQRWILYDEMLGVQACAFSFSFFLICFGFFLFSSVVLSFTPVMCCSVHMRWKAYLDLLEVAWEGVGLGAEEV